VANARFLLRPQWILSHLLVALLAVVLVNLGFWQLRRLDERRAENALIEARQDEPPVELDEVLTPASTAAEAEELRARAVTLVGTYDEAATVDVHNRTQDGVAGDWMVTPLVLESGDRVGVVRGFVALGPDGDPYPAQVPEGEVTVEGAVMVPRLQDRTVRHDLEDMLAAPDTLGVLIRAEKSSPAEPAAATLDGEGDPQSALYSLPPPELTERNHLSYAVQWFIFATIAVVGYPLILRRVLQRRGKEVDAIDGGNGNDGDDGPGRAHRNGDGTGTAEEADAVA
jgi:surfeit locus 1 family protein